ncbi:phage portal protein [bacterium]|nr:phage portal protein [bacterium]
MAERVKGGLVRRNVIDRVVEAFDPIKAMERYAARSRIEIAAQSGFFTPGSGGTVARSWVLPHARVDQEVHEVQEDIREGSRDLAKNSPISAALIRRVRDNVVGTGLLLQAKPDRTVLGLDDKQAQAIERQIEREFALWASTCDATGHGSWADLQAQALIGRIRDGETLALLPWVERDGEPYATRVQMLDPAQLKNPPSGVDQKDWVNGVKVDDYGRPLAYSLRRWQPTGWQEKYETVPSFGSSGRRNVLHLFEREFPGQHRGLPMLYPVLRELKQITRLTDAELDAAVVQSFFTAFIETENEGGGAQGMLGDGVSDSEKIDASDETKVEMGPGMTVSLFPGEKVQMAQPNRPSGAFEPFYRALIEMIGAAVGVPYEVILEHFQSSYSASRASLLEAWKFFRKERAWFAANWCQRIYVEFLREAVLRGRLDLPGYLDNAAARFAWQNATWVGMGMGMIDPLKEVNAAEKRINLNLSTWSDEYAQMAGGDWEAMAERKQRESAHLDDLGLSHSGASEGPADDPDPNETNPIENPNE